MISVFDDDKQSQSQSPQKQNTDINYPFIQTHTHTHESLLEQKQNHMIRTLTTTLLSLIPIIIIHHPMPISSGVPHNIHVPLHHVLTAVQLQFTCRRPGRRGLLLYHIHVLVLRTHVVQSVRAKGLRGHRTTRRQSKIGRRVAGVAHVVVGLPRLVVEVVHLRVVGGRRLVVVRVLVVVLIVPEVVRLVVRHVAQRIVGGLRRDRR